jgi:predicted  nucleic acid-binding Zn-ribbon protein
MQRNSIRRVTQEMYEAYDDFDDARVELQEARVRVEDSRNEVIQMKTGLQTSIAKLERLLSNFQSPRMLNSLNPRDRSTFQRELDNVRHDIDEARLRVSEVEDDTSAVIVYIFHQFLFNPI